MANLRELKAKLNTVRSIRKLTSAMKLVAGVKLKKSESKAVAYRGYADGFKRIISGIRVDFLEKAPELLVGRENVCTVLLIVFFSDKGLCGNFNYSIMKGVQSEIQKLRKNGKRVYLLCMCKRAYDSLKLFTKNEDVIELFENSEKNDISDKRSQAISEYAYDLFMLNKIDCIKVIYTKHISAISRKVVVDSIIPIEECEQDLYDTITIFEPSEGGVLNNALKENMFTQIHRAALENFASENSARMAAMDTATKNADDLSAKLALKYNRLRQSKITLELVEVISGAEALSDVL